MEQETKGTTAAVSKLSYSSLTLLLRNPLIFKMQEIFGVYDRPSSMSAMIGKACHECLKLYYGGAPEVEATVDPAKRKDKAEWRGICRQFGLEYLEMSEDNYIDYGATGNREEMFKGYTKAMDFYFAEEPQYNKIVVCEEKLEGEITTVICGCGHEENEHGNGCTKCTCPKFQGQKLPLPAVGKPDIVEERADGKFDIVDAKFVKAFTNYEKEDWLKIIQAQFMDHLLRATKGIRADRVVFREVKRTLNMEKGKPTGEPQVRDYIVPLTHRPYRVFFYNLYRDCANFILNPNAIFLPNIGDPMDGEQAGLIYAQGLISADMSDVEVVHKVRDVAFTSKKFIPSRLESAINKDLLPEEKIKMRLAEFGIPVEPVETIKGASVTQYRFKVSAGVSMPTIKKHRDDIARAIEAKGDVRIVAPIPGTSFVGVEVESTVRTTVKLGAAHMKNGTLSMPIGVNVSGEIVYVPLDEAPHLLVAGATGSGKSYFLHSTITALSKQLTPDELQMVLIDPKRVELANFASLPHLRGEVIDEYEDGLRALLGLVDEMEARYKALKKAGKRNIRDFNASKREAKNRLPYIVAVVDEFADFMLQSEYEEKRRDKSYSAHSKEWLYRKASKGVGGLQPINTFTKARLIEILEAADAEDETKRVDANVEQLVVRLAQKARAVGIHLILATQRPSVDVITGLIKANFPTRIALTTASPTDSVVILGVPGAEKLSGKGDMLLMSPTVKGLVRLQGLTP